MPQIINGRYALSGAAKCGAFAEVFKASDLENPGQVVAVKLYKGGMPGDPVIKEAFERESQRLVDLRHENIVSMLDYGVDGATSRPFLVMEWAGEPIEEWWQLNRPGKVSWEQYFEELGRPLISALAFAHSRETVHRELKPADILRGSDGRIRLSDFGVAKFPEFFDTELDIEKFLKGKEPFSPINGYDPNYSYSTDVYSYAAIAIYFTGTTKFVSWGELYKNLQISTAPKEIRALLEECLSKEAAERPVNALVLQSKLNSATRNLVVTIKKACYLGLTNSAYEKLKNICGHSSSRREIEDFINKDFKEVTSIDWSRERESYKPIPFSYRLYGETLTLVVKVDNNTSSQLVIVDAWREFSCEKHELLRSRVKEFPFEVKIGEWADLDSGRQFIANLEDALTIFENERTQRSLQEAEDEFFKTWRSVLELKLDHCRKSDEYEYDGYELDGDLVTFNLQQSPDATSVEEIWKIVGKNVSGIVESTTDGTMTLLMQTESSSIPQKGRLKIDSASTEKQIRKQISALDSIKNPKSETTERLHKRLINPSECETAGDVAMPGIWFNVEIDENKKTAIHKALQAKDFFIVQGPPGTGKTTFISELILQHLSRWPDKRILLTSQTHIAVDNAIERVAKIRPELKIVRIGYAESRVAQNAQAYLLQKRIQEWSRRVRDDAAAFLKQSATKEGIDISKIQVGLDIAVILSNQRSLESVTSDEDALVKRKWEIQVLLEETDEDGNPKQQGSSADNLLTEQQSIEVELENVLRIRQERSYSLRIKREEFKKKYPEWTDLLEEDSKALEEWQNNFIGTSDKEKKFRKLFELSTEWIQRFFLKDDCQEAILSDSDLVCGTCIGVESAFSQDEDFGLCILDEASKATMTEALVPLAKSAKWILVGDRYQLSPFLEAALDDSKKLTEAGIKIDIFKQTLLDKLIDSNLPMSGRITLTRQHRMIASIGDLISKVFYENQLESIRTNKKLDISILFPKEVVWISTSKQKDHFEKQSGTSLVNPLEVQKVAEILKNIDFVFSNRRDITKKPTVAVLTGYAAQRNYINNKLNNITLNSIEVESHTVDAYQGKEADIVIFSVVRSNSKGKAGFLKDKRRINVALSRAREYLIIVGDSDFCVSIGSSSTLGNVIEYITGNQQTCALVEEKS